MENSVLDIETGCEKLARQIATPINWAACLTACQAAGAETALELGPGAAFSHMAAQIFTPGRALEPSKACGLWSQLGIRYNT